MATGTVCSREGLRHNGKAQTGKLSCNGTCYDMDLPWFNSVPWHLERWGGVRWTIISFAQYNSILFLICEYLFFFFLDLSFSNTNN